FDEIWKHLIDHAVAEFAPDLIGVTCMFTMTHASFKNVSEHAATTGHPVAIGGVHVSNDVERVLADVPSPSFAFLRYADATLALFCRVVNGEAPVDALKQLIVRDGVERIRYLDDYHPTVDEFDVTPAFDLTEIKRLSEYGVIGIFHAFVEANTPTATCLT